MMTERDAWLDIATWWHEPRLYLLTLSNGKQVTLAKAGCPHCDDCNGICECLAFVKVSDETRERMNRRIRKEMVHMIGVRFLFPLTKKGARQRAALCMQFADECTPKKRSRKVKGAKT
jgi:hypothetical protein